MQVAMGSPSLTTKFHLPVAFIMALAHVCDLVGYILNKKFKLTPFR
jgi:hypothetical protein